MIKYFEKEINFNPYLMREIQILLLVFIKRAN